MFRLLGLLPGLDQISISLRDIVPAFVGSLIRLRGDWALAPIPEIAVDHGISLCRSAGFID
jgi:hypothetical protein